MKTHAPLARLARLTPLAATVLAALPAFAQDLTVKAPPQTRPIAIVNATIHPVSGEPVADGAILFAEGLIVGVYDRASWPDALRAAGGEQRVALIDAGGQHVYPGLISPYSQLGLTEIQAVRQTNDTAETGDFSPEVVAVTAVNPDSTLLPVTRSNGVLVAGVFPTGGIVPGRASVIRLDGWTTGEMAVAAQAGLIVRWPSTRTFTAWWMDRSEEDQQRDAQRALTRIREIFDAAEAYHAQRTADPGAPIDLRWEAMRAVFGTRQSASDSGAQPPSMPVYVLANDLDQINGAVTFFAERGLRCVIVGGRDADRCAELLTKHGVPVILSSGTFVMPRRADSPYDDAFSLPARLHGAGITFAIAVGDDTAHERNLPYAAAMAAAHGLPADAALRAITLDAARVLGVADRYGSLDAGKSATLILTTGTPLEVTTQVRRAFIDGREIDLSNKQTKLYEKYRERYRQTGDLKEP
ncbi:MAG: amidohydrolase family protein [Planctomycetota bacterium]|nr:amidohydrolase family protein [Planctomycetota bacterium]